MSRDGRHLAALALECPDERSKMVPRTLLQVRVDHVDRVDPGLAELQIHDVHVFDRGTDDQRVHQRL